MHWLSELFFGFITIYLALLNSIADPINSLTNKYTPNNSLTKLDSAYTDKSIIPDILISNSSYQKASLFEGFTPNLSVTKDPREALVNIICTRTTENLKHTSTGTGFFIHPDGVILTNAHVAQLLLLEGNKETGEMNCIIRSGNPATPKYEASLLYIPPSWVQSHADQIAAKSPSGTGERDYALLYVTSGLNNKPMPRIFPALGIETDQLTYDRKNSLVRLAGYPAAALFTEGPSVELLPKIATSTISEMYTFDTNKADVISIRGTEVGEQGSSGGPIVDDDGHVIGIISTRGNDAVDGHGSLRAITMSYIDRTIKEETGFNLEQNVTGNLPRRALIFKETLAPFLAKLLQFEIVEE